MFSALFKRRKKTASASIAKERLQIIVAHERNQNSPSQQPDFLKALQQDILEVVRKYMSIDGDQIKVAMDKEDGFDVLELNITLSEKEEEALEAQAADAEETSSQAEPSHETR
ncbi:Cell division topological specificity factor [Wohlfahrtiimonas chitiniclastica SH04]|uniref:Cell division topological specificity factor n=1 Tax=Wohlfahrtiimonas chitiniclastica SH04 TaxID=1261130 RepID=L8XUB1_9GAMM|nr:Cell division topological specificity factor [Wohlfahrtiimonas chitiniclastica SH04]MBS7820774.1 cell division topological specificity factor MinE [Wohlfahrtiimonas chitiniclastica]OYQ75003.1 cell division topological specificity factor MinE [Wohlfahrtiimonas chitiniclastica]OYQ88330.1 cell division topological specificity factor MinE [Wohlfahrtiimonas chitiniclastica]OYQ88752.1 cell division topological specificity factor MinE [Wohlfahrtiimonas chitiniclastica]